MLDITGVNLVEFAKKAYELSSPQGLGFLHYKPEPLSDEHAKQIVDRSGNGRNITLDMDYIEGRAVKMTVYRNDGKLSIQERWYDHTDAQLKDLLASFNINSVAPVKHSAGCNCVECQHTRG